MPKMKTRRGAAKRFKLTASGPWTAINPVSKVASDMSHAFPNFSSFHLLNQSTTASLLPAFGIKR